MRGAVTRKACKPESGPADRKAGRVTEVHNREHTMGRLDGKVAFISGAAAGIGRRTAVRFVEEGARVCVADIDADGGAETVRLAGESGAASGGEAFFALVDVTEHDSVRAGIAATVERYGALNVLHNNVGGSTANDGPVTEAPDSEFWRCMRVDVFGTFLCSKYGIPEMIRSGGGSVINMASNLALMGLGGRDCYTAAKGAVAAMTRSMAVEYAPHKIRVNAIAPSLTLTDRARKQLEDRSSFSDGVRELAKSHLLGLGQPIHIANMALYLASDESEITTGQVMRVDSGVTIH